MLSMIKVKSYRPLVTENLIWDFPSRFKLKTASDFMQEDLSDLTDFISQTAKETMSNQSAYWFIEDKKNQKIVSLVTLKDIDHDKHAATLSIEFDCQLNDDLYDEIIERLYMLVNEQLKLVELSIGNVPSKICNFFTLNGYNLLNNKLKRK